MDFPIDQIGTVLQAIEDNLGVVSATALAIIAGFDKLALVVIKTLGNIRDAWRETFPKGG
jgi:hypothetical protein